MKIGGTKIEAMSRTTITLPRPEGVPAPVIKVRAFPLGDEAPGMKLFPEPQVPQGLASGANGLPLRDPKTGKAIVVDLHNDPAYLAKSEESDKMSLIVSALSVMEEVEFETTMRPGTREWFLDAYEEMKRAGLTLGDLNIILQTAKELSNLTQKRLEEAAGSF